MTWNAIFNWAGLGGTWGLKVRTFFRLAAGDSVQGKLDVSLVGTGIGHSEIISLDSNHLVATFNITVPRV